MQQPPVDRTRIFIDESGSPTDFDELVNNSGERFYTVAAVIIKDSDYRVFRANLEILHRRYHYYLGEREIKSRSIRHSNPRGVDPSSTKQPPDYDFWKYPEGQQMYDQFCADLKDLLRRTPFQVVSVSIDKVVAKQAYPHSSVILTSLTDLWERLYISLLLSKAQQSWITIDPRRNIDDQVTRESFKQFTEQGSWYIDSQKVQNSGLSKYIFFPDSKISPGLQLVDLCAHPIRAHHTHGHNDFFEEVVRAKLHTQVKDKRTQRIIEMGLRLSLRKRS